jgi:hypothetical protein
MIFSKLFMDASSPICFFLSMLLCSYGSLLHNGCRTNCGRRVRICSLELGKTWKFFFLEVIDEVPGFRSIMESLNGEAKQEILMQAYRDRKKAHGSPGKCCLAFEGTVFMYLLPEKSMELRRRNSILHYRSQMRSLPERRA